jgi:hypothetical protein
VANSIDGEDESALLLDFDRRLMHQFHGSTTASDAGLLDYRELMTRYS